MLKRARSTKLTARASPYHASVTLFESKDAELPDSPRRSKRIKVETSPTAAVDLEKTAHNDDSESKSTRKKVVKSSDARTNLKQAAKSPRKPKPIQQSLEVPHPAPSRWQETYDTIKQMRSRVVAPVDTMGCDQAQYKEEDPKVCMTRVFLLSIMSLTHS
jgi:endonuclease III